MKPSINTRCIAVLMFLTVAGSLPSSAQTPKQYPQYGEIRYNGAYLVQTDFYWKAVGNWHDTDPALELDMNLFNVDYFDSCTISSNMPSWYDDCGFAGVMDDGYEGFGAGSYKPETVSNYTWYYADWNFSGGSAVNSNFSLGWQEMEHVFCFWDSPSCMGGACDPGCGGVLRSGSFTWGTPLNTSWNY